MSQDDNVGVSAVGQAACPRCAFVNPAAHRYCGQCGTFLPVGTGTPRQVPERRQLTVLFCDLIGSTKIATRLDPEDFRDVVMSFQSACTGIIERFGGTVSRYMGDGILALFGYPHAREDDAESATRAGLAIVDVVPKIDLSATFPTDECLAVRVGIATGLVIVGDLIGLGPAEEEAVVGEAPNIAARLQASAVPNSVLVSETTRSLLGSRFDCAEPVLLALRGYDEPIRAYPVQAPTNVIARRLSIFTPIVNRSAECAALERNWRAAAGGRGRSVLLHGEAGIGKSRIVAELYARIRQEPHWLLRYQCSPYYSNTALHPLSEQVAFASGIGSEDRPEQKLKKLARWLGSDNDSAESLALMAALLSIPLPDDSLLSSMSHQRRKERTFELLMEMAERYASGRPLLVVFEDLHWADPTTLELLDIVADRATQMKALVVMTARPEFARVWASNHNVDCLELRRLGPEESLQLMGNVAGEVRILDATMAEMVARADGIPLFIEELTKALLAGERSIPASLQDSLMARLDRLGQAKHVAQIAGVLGREFAQDLLAAVVDMPLIQLQDALRALEDAGLIRELSSAEAGIYEFKHALIQEAAYESLLRRRRRELHRRIAEILQSHFPGITRDEPELVAHHWTEADEPERAIQFWLLAGRRASERSQYREAIARLRNGLALLPHLQDDSLRRERELELRIALGPALITTEGGGAAEVTASYTRTLALCEGQPSSAARFAAGWGWWRASMNHTMGRERADKLLALSRDLNDPALTLQAHHCQWATLYMLGAHRECQRHVEAGLSLYQRDRDHAYAASYGGHDARVCALGEGALAAWMLGFPDKGLDLAQSASAWSRELSHVGSRVHGMDYALVLKKFRRDIVAVRRAADELAAYAGEQKLQVHRAKGTFFRGWARAMQGDVPDGLAEMLDGIASERASDTPHDFTLYYEMLAEIYGLAGRLDDAIRAVGDAFAVAERHGIVFWNAELHRRRGELLRAAGDREGADAAFQEALACARGQEARSLELRAAVSLARLRLSEGDSSTLRAVLLPLYTGFSEGYETPDLKEARSLKEAVK